MPHIDPRWRVLIVDDWFLVAVAMAVMGVFAVALVFAAYAVRLRVKNRRTSERWTRLEQKWTGPILDVLAGTEAPQVLLERVDAGEQFYFIEFLYRYAIRFRGRERAIISDMAAPYLGRLVARVRTGDAEQRARAVQTLSVLALDTYAPLVLAALDDPAPLVAMVAARALARPEHAEHAGAVLERIHRFQDWSPRFLASMLASIGPAAAPFLRDTLADSGCVTAARAVAADALRRLNDLPAADIAARILVAEAAPDLQAAALRILQRVGRQQHLPVVREMCTSPEFAVRAQAVGALRYLGMPEDVVRLHDAFDDPSPWVALHAARGLVAVCGEDTLTELAAQRPDRTDLARQVLAESR